MAEDIIFCLTRDFSDSTAYSQGFRSAIGGDTADGEGRYYLWNEDELKRILPEGDVGLFCAAYAVLPSGNFGSELAGSQMSWNILYEASTVNELAKRYGIKGAEVGRRLFQCRKTLLEVRDKRYPLASDNKILMNWNGLAVGALARASVAFEESEWREIAERAALFLQKNLPEKNNNNWRRSWIEGHAGIDAIAEDYAFLLWGIIELYKAAKHFNAGERQLNDWIKLAQSLADTMIEKFWDEKNGGLFLTAADAPNIFIRMKSAEDNSVPSANAVASIALNELAIILEEKKYSDYARNIIGCFSHYASENPLACLSLLVADLMWKSVKKKAAPAPEPVHVPTDEELNAEDLDTENQASELKHEIERRPRTSRRSARSEGDARAERTERRNARSHRRASRN